MIYAATGHRPPKVGGYSLEARTKLERFAIEFVGRTRQDITKGICGMAQGWDQAWGWALAFYDIPFIAAVPFEGFDGKWPREARRDYFSLLGRAQSTMVVSLGPYAVWKLHKRNEWMVNQCDKIVALHDGSEEGGTFECLQYARRKEKPITNLWDEFKASLG